MDRTAQMASELESMMEAGEIDQDMADEIVSIIQELREGNRTLNEFYGASTSPQLLEVLDEVNQRVKR